MSEQVPKWCLILDKWIAMAERELKKSEKKGTVAAAPNKAMPSTHPKKERGNKHYD